VGVAGYDREAVRMLANRLVLGKCEADPLQAVRGGALARPKAISPSRARTLRSARRVRKCDPPANRAPLWATPAAGGDWRLAAYVCPIELVAQRLATRA
jgi:hypothetical protein